MFIFAGFFAALARLLALLALLLILTPTPALALTKKAAIESCREKVGRPMVMSCMRGGGGSLEGCREKAHPSVVACVKAALNAANGRANVAVAVPTQAAPKALPGTALPAGFIAPPRTISDIRAILDSENPDPALIEKLKATANAVPTGKESRTELSQFYFDRSAARSQLGKLADAIADANKLERKKLRDVAYLRSICEKLKLPVNAGSGAGKLQFEIFEKTVEPDLKAPTFIIDYPMEVSPLSRRKDSDPFLTDRFEFYVGGRELANGFSELNDPEDQAERFRAQAVEKDAGDHEAMFYDADDVRALEYGMPPAAGEGIGIDRLVMLFTDSASIRDVILFPLMRPETQ